MRAIVAFLSLILPAVYVSAQSTPADPRESDQATQRAAESLRLANEEAAKFAYYLASDPDLEVKLHPAPVHRHTYLRTGESYSSLYVWTCQGRPTAIASINNWYSPRRYLGLSVTSLSTERLIGTRDGKEIWRPQSAGVEFHPIPDADAPSETTVQRLREMRVLARRFTAEFKRVAKYPEGGKLRLLSTPLYRYQSPDLSLLDGALFGFASGTAPELILLIEARRTEMNSRWEYALAPRNSTEYHVWYEDRKVWSLPQLAPPWPNSKDPTNTYTVFPDLQRENRTEEFVKQLQDASQISNNR